MADAKPDLAAMVTEIDDWHRYAADPAVAEEARRAAMTNITFVIHDHWPTISAALQRLEELEQRAANERAHTHRAILDRAKDEQSRELLEWAWTIIANAGGGDWTKESPEWQHAAERWRDKVHDLFPGMG